MDGKILIVSGAVMLLVVAMATLMTLGEEYDWAKIAAVMLGLVIVLAMVAASVYAIVVGISAL